MNFYALVMQCNQGETKGPSDFQQQITWARRQVIPFCVTLLSLNIRAMMILKYGNVKNQNRCDQNLPKRIILTFGYEKQLAGQQQV